MAKPSSDSIKMDTGGTIFALSSAPGRAGVSVFRVSGPNALMSVQTLTGAPCPVPRRAAFRRLYNGDVVIDEALVIVMPAPNSFTGEDVAEFQTHGSLAVIDAMAAALLATGARHAAPGEFTRRAFINGRMDLTEAEGLADLIDAQTEGQRVQALRQMQGGLRDIYEMWRSDLIDALAMVEGEIDFPDEGDVPDALALKATPPIESAVHAMQMAISEAGRGERVRAGLNIAVIGKPNAGKSSIINRIAGRDVAIVSDEAGTTRDIIDVPLVMAGLPIRLSDTAGLRAAETKIEAEGVRRAKQRSSESDIRIYVHDSTEGEISEAETKSLRPGDIILFNKSDQRKTPPALPHNRTDIHIFYISAQTGAGFKAFLDFFEQCITERFSPQNLPGLTRLRHLDCTQRALDAALRASGHLRDAPELAGDDLRSALHAIKELAGETDMDAVFDRIFSRFCIGK